jgi:hypothetical protein
MGAAAPGWGRNRVGVTAKRLKGTPGVMGSRRSECMRLIELHAYEGWTWGVLVILNKFKYNLKRRSKIHLLVTKRPQGALLKLLSFLRSENWAQIRGGLSLLWGQCPMLWIRICTLALAQAFPLAPSERQHAVIPGVGPPVLRPGSWSCCIVLPTLSLV